jgi:hypothetical protein
MTMERLSLKGLAFVAALVLVAFGIAGLNLLHIATGILALVFAMAGEAPSRTFFRLIGIVYGLVAVMGLLLTRDGHLLGMEVDTADHLLHAGVAVVGSWLGFFTHPGWLRET